MSKFTKLLNQVEKERNNRQDETGQSIENINQRNTREEEKMKNSWLVWVFVVGVVVTMLIAFNYQGAQDTVPLSEIFPETETYPVEIEYVDQEPVSDIQQVAQDSTEIIQEVPQIAEAAPKPVVKSPITIVADKPVVKAEPVKAAREKINYTIQVASFKDKAKAEKKLAELKKKDYKPFLVSKELRNKGTWHRIYVGKFDSKQEANDYLPKVRTDYSGSFIISPK